MKIENLHSWNISYKEAVKVQEELSSKIKLIPYEGLPKIIGGADVSYSKNEEELLAVIVLLSYPGFEIVESTSYISKVFFPYIPGLLSFRELPPLIKAYEKLDNIPDILILDGQGIAHPRYFGLASHAGAYLNIPTIGCAKKKLCGDYKIPKDKPGETSPLIYKERIVGSVIRTRKNCKPIFVSPGYMMDIQSSIRIIKLCLTKYRIPEPTRIAHLLTKNSRIIKQIT
ncbi:deoxyribonuclease V [bacterium]|nr:deoxyribonuclease V [bacterium]